MPCLMTSQLGSVVRSTTDSMETRTDSEHDLEYDLEHDLEYDSEHDLEQRVGDGDVTNAGGRRWDVVGVGLPSGSSSSTWGSTSNDAWPGRKQGAIAGRCCLLGLLRSTCGHGGLNGSCRRTSHELRR